MSQSSNRVFLYGTFHAFIIFLQKPPRKHTAEQDLILHIDMATNNCCLIFIDFQYVLWDCAAKDIHHNE